MVLQRLHKIVNKNSLISSRDVIVYQLDEKDGLIQKLPAPEGIPTDKNFLNMKIREANNLFDALLEIEEDISNMNFFDVNCQETPRNDELFGICDDQNGEKAIH